MAKEA